jgi:chemotaxis protein methyltransferase CheR
MNHEDFTSEEIISLLDTFYQKYGFDFRNYNLAHIKRRVNNRMAVSGINDVSEFQSLILSSRSFAELFLKDLSINVTEMFRDPLFYDAVREHIIPRLKTYSFFKIWHAGCSTGEEVYSMAILLTEEGIYERALIYATDYNEESLHHAREGIYSVDKMKDYTRNYQLSHGKLPLSNYYTSKYNNVIMDQCLKKNIMWANHNLATDSVFAEVNLIICRNVLIYFNKTLQDKVHHLFYNSLSKGGFLCLGTKETLRYSNFQDKFIEEDRAYRIYAKKY